MDDVPDVRRSLPAGTPVHQHDQMGGLRTGSEAGPGLIWRTGDHFGDWLALHSDDAGYPGATKGKDFIATTYLAHSADIVSRAAGGLHRADDVPHYAAVLLVSADVC